MKRIFVVGYDPVEDRPAVGGFDCDYPVYEIAGFGKFAFMGDEHLTEVRDERV